MADPKREELKVGSKRAVLVGVLPPERRDERERAFDEITGLLETADAEVVGTVLQVRDKPNPATYIGSGKVAEVKQLIEQTDADLIAFDANLSPAQGKAIEDETGTVVVDRSEVILDIFATHARSYEARLQVELAQLLYMRPRLTRMWTHLERIEGGIGSGRGPGEKQLETDRRLVDRRIAELKRKIKEVEQRRERTVAGRRDHMTVSLVGYTNAGKSTLMNALTGADVYIADQLFATLDTRTRKWTLPNWGDVLLSDTVGFISNLPHHLVASFRSTLAEARHADLLLHVVDASHPDAEKHIKTVNSVLNDIGVDSEHPILVFNKLDNVPDRTTIDILRSKYSEGITVSAAQRIGLEKLEAAVAERLGEGYLNAQIETSVGNGRLFAWLAEHADVTDREYNDSRVTLSCRLPRKLAASIAEEGTTVTLLNGHRE
ncbi:MAG: GTPase HflX [Planctomycetaceae bacterium]|nr:GTPase HflX [Planctomycetaceae bacterium]